MLPYLLNIFHLFMGIKVPTVFTYYSTKMMLAAITSLLVSILLGPRFIKKLYELKIGQSIRMEECPLLGQLHEKKQNTPTMGGVLILFSMLVSLFLWMDLSHIFTLILLFTTLGLGFIGGIDDYLKLKYKNTKGLPARKKFLAQLLVSGLIGFYLLSPYIQKSLEVGHWFAIPIIKDPNQQLLSLSEYMTRIYVPFMKEPVIVFSGIFFTIFLLFYVMFIVTGSSNSVNLTDGLDGLAAGCLIMVAAALAFVAFLSNHYKLASYLHILYIEGSGEIAIYLSALIGACIGFLWYNGYPAQVFMGDTGSLALGGVIGVSAILLRREALLAIVGGVFVAETLSVILQVASYKWRNKKRIFLCSPLHHHFEYLGWPETKVVVRFWIIGLLLALIGLASLKFQ